MENPILTSDRYLAERLAQYQAWYDRKAVRMKLLYLRMRAFTVVGGGLVPVLANIGAGWLPGGIPVVRILLTAVSLLVVVFVSLESVFHYREQWKNYRATEQLLGHERFRFLARVGPYRELAEQAAFLLLVERVEDAIAAENAATLSVMTLAAETSDELPKAGGSI
jgi:hypothetical protein